MPELLDHILGFLHGDRTTLRSCATSSRVLTPVAQRHLFYWITSLKLQANYITPARLRVILAGSPHLAPLIPRVDLSISVEADAELASPTLDAARLLIGLPSVRRVEVIGSYHHLRLLGRLLGDYTSQLKEIVFRHTFVPQTLADGDLPWPPAAKNSMCTRLTRLALVGSDSLMTWLVNEACPFNISHLVDVDVSGGIRGNGMHKHTQPLLEHARFTIQRLRFPMALVSPAHGGPFIYLTRFPALTHLTANTPMEELSYIFPAMEKLDPQNNIREVLFTSPAFDDPVAGQQLEPMLREFDAAFAALPLPACKCVEIQVHKTRRNLPQYLIRRIEELKPQAVPFIHQREAAALSPRHLRHFVTSLSAAKVRNFDGNS
ncbi:hypothetical protein DFH08DRAFT_1082502 [Mycena albidolilacea]|uniref:Uncharacterized protein n=1 Tax=Mycena albidolilacea TaxID=1033008 RepID=A0AAD7ENT7_9AGAR|nr:hypothetical protein DFH08DRAFT_1082502 [Mycena albidolilacea]